MDFKLQVVPVPVSDVDRSIAFYRDSAGFALDHDHKVSPELRFVQLTPPGSECSIVLGVGIVDSAPGSVRGLQLVVDDIHAARAELAGRGVEVSDVKVAPGGAFVYFADPDGNTWTVQDPRAS
jgi:catechol 2,3-dioxygenase-like lactoylglutathione lyase family enzyme